MTIQEAVTNAFVKRGINPQLDEYSYMDKNVFNTIAGEVYLAVLPFKVVQTRQEQLALMQEIDDEMESRGYDVFQFISPTTNFKPKPKDDIVDIPIPVTNEALKALVRKFIDEADLLV